MRIQFEMEGGVAVFPGLSKPITIKTDDLSADEAAQLQQLVTRSKFFDQPAKVGQPAPGAADYRTFTITIEDGKRRHTISICDPIEDNDVAALVEFLRARVNN